MSPKTVKKSFLNTLILLVSFGDTPKKKYKKCHVLFEWLLIVRCHDLFKGIKFHNFHHIWPYFRWECHLILCNLLFKWVIFGTKMLSMFNHHVLKIFINAFKKNKVWNFIFVFKKIYRCEVNFKGEKGLIRSFTLRINMKLLFTPRKKLAAGSKQV